MAKYRRHIHSSYYRPEKKKRVGFYVFTTIIAGLVIFTIRSSLTSPHFYIKDVQVEGIERLTTSEVLQQVLIPPDTSIFKLDINRIFREIQSQSLVKKVTVRKKLPSTILIEVIERTPYVCVGKDKKFWEVDEEGVVLKAVQDFEGLLLIEGIDPFKEKEVLLKALNILKFSRRLNLTVERIEVERGDRGIVTYLDNNIQLILGVTPRYNYLFYIPDILQDARKRGEKFTRIDLRFEKQIVASRR